MLTCTNPAMPELIAQDGRLMWRFADGRLLPVVRGGDGDDGDDKKFTQADLDRIVQERLARVKPEAPADYADLQAKAKKLDELEAANNSDLEKAQAKITKLESDLATAQGETESAKGESKTLKLRMAVVAEAAKQKAVNPDQVFALLPTDAVTIGDDGQVTGAENAVKTFIEANPHFVGTKTGPKPDPGQGKRDDAKAFGEGGLAEAAKRFPGSAPAATGTQQQ